MPAWIGPAIVAPSWGLVSVQLILQGWLATANFFIAIVAWLRGRKSGEHAFGAVIGALVTSLACSLLLRGGFWLLVEVLAFGRTLLEQVIYLVFMAASAAVLLRRFPTQVQQSWRRAMSLDPLKEDGTKGTARSDAQ